MSPPSRAGCRPRTSPPTARAKSRSTRSSSRSPARSLSENAGPSSPRKRGPRLPFYGRDQNDRRPGIEIRKRGPRFRGDDGEGAFVMTREAPALRAINLAGKWARVAQGHVALSGMACACGLGFVAIGVADFEQHLLDYLYTRHRATPEMEALFANAGYAEGTRGSVTQLLRALAAAPPPSAGALLDDVERSIDSFETVHGKS